jgi:sugar-specific transcriptional regulator TrmB
MQISQLTDIGLTKNQAVVYLELIKNPGQNPGKLSKRLSLDRSFVYGIIKNLIEKGLISSVIKENKQLFYPSDPENLLNELDEKRLKIISVVKNINKVKHESKEEASVRVYEGKAGLKAYIREFLGTSEFLMFGGGGNLGFLNSLKYDYLHYIRDINKKKIKGKLLTSKKNKNILSGLYGSNVSIKTVDGLNQPAGISIVRNKVGLLTSNEKPRVVIIDDHKIAETLRIYFNKVWTMSN